MREQGPKNLKIWILLSFALVTLFLQIPAGWYFWGIAFTFSLPSFKLYVELFFCWLACWQNKSSCKECSIKKLFLKNLKYSQENTCVKTPFFSKVVGLQKQGFSCDYCEFLRTPFLKNISGGHFWKNSPHLKLNYSLKWLLQRVFSVRNKLQPVFPSLKWVMEYVKISSSC